MDLSLLESCTRHDVAVESSGSAETVGDLAAGPVGGPCSKPPGEFLGR